ncbi:probable rRNA maturation factor [Peptoclostridium litorale DSM 5388]|uniref:Endoribonuclease YbeY n=1 Tax=Peptoclostridium litorale DSM 5388 TaxID=1121324 RepID=A0A069RDE9_PEPLI|nr:rRNA maturation RNase YbeY [Peptoclostridium litorale]KDR95084.1 endoribonuclease [Peptoclostridium litorale DSM 5388]SIN75284.1 probable rRNA maturation factor [Peptoclostridium litorale DSM 5388]
MNIELDNRQDKIDIDGELLQKLESVMEKCLEYEGWDRDYEVSMVFVDNAQIRELNSDFRNIDRETDVLSFPLVEDGEFQLEEKLLGDIVISLEKALEQSLEYGHSFEREMAFLVCHSMFHLMGYDHDNEENTKIMRSKEEDVLGKLGIKRD